MDDRTFDARVRALAGTADRRTVLGALAGLLAGGTALDTDAKRRRKCRKTSPSGQCCRNDGSCTCLSGGSVCGENCCTSGERCEDGACVSDAGLECRVLGAACKASGRACCDGLVCGSGQGGQGDVACYSPAGAACARTAECVFGTSCIDGACVADRQPETAPPCEAECCADADCATGYVCGAEQTCVCGGECCGNDQCPDGKICSETQTCVCGSGCCGNADCGPGQRCDGPNGCITCSGTAYQCYWLGYSTGDWAWEPATWVEGGYEGCLEYNQCGNGGGCYAWKDSTLCDLPS